MGREQIITDEAEGLEMLDMSGDDLEISSPEAAQRASVAAKYNVTDAKIAEIGQRYMPLRIAGAEDKQGYALVHAARQEVKGLRGDVEKRRKGLKEDSLAYGRAVDAEAKRITALLAPIESHLEAEQKRIDGILEAVKAEKQRILDERNQGRLNALLAVDVIVDLAEVVLMTDAVFNSFLEMATKAHAEKVAKAAEDAAALEAKTAAEAAEKARIEKETADKLEAMRSENERIRLENEKMAADLKAQRDAMDKQKADMDRAARDEQIRKDAAAKAEQDAKAAEARKAAMEAAKPDIEKLFAMVEAVDALAWPVMATDAGRAALADIETLRQKFRGYIESRAKALTSPF